MSGHSKWATIKRQKAANDNARGKVFSKLSKAIVVAIKTGGGPNIESNYRLRVAVDAAKAENMPKDTIDRAIAKASQSGNNVEEITYEGFGPAGVNILVQVATDNRNRTAQEIKSIFDRAGGTLGQPGSVSFNFELKGWIRLARERDIDEQILKLIDLGVEDVVEETAGELSLYVPGNELFEARKRIEDAGFIVFSAELVQKPKLKVQINDPVAAGKLFAIVDSLENNDDVQKVFDNADIPENVLAQARD